MSYSILGIVLLVIYVITILNILKSGLSLVGKLVWIAIVIVLPVIGTILWFLIGAKKI